jgi:hypothetical protein
MFRDTELRADEGGISTDFNPGATVTSWLRDRPLERAVTRAVYRGPSTAISYQDAATAS